MKTPVILAIGAAGKLAGLVVPALAPRGVDIRAFITDATQETAVRAKGASEIAVGDSRDQKSVDAALKGVDAVFYIAPAFLPDESVVGENFVKSASRAGVIVASYHEFLATDERQIDPNTKRNFHAQRSSS